MSGAKKALKAWRRKALANICEVYFEGIITSSGNDAGKVDALARLRCGLGTLQQVEETLKQELGVK